MVFWKVENLGSEAEKLDRLRGGDVGVGGGGAARAVGGVGGGYRF